MRSAAFGLTARGQRLGEESSDDIGFDASLILGDLGDLGANFRVDPDGESVSWGHGSEANTLCSAEFDSPWDRVTVEHMRTRPNTFDTVYEMLMGANWLLVRALAVVALTGVSFR